MLTALTFTPRTSTDSRGMAAREPPSDGDEAWPDAILRNMLVVNPCVGALQPISKPDARFPSEVLPDAGVIRVPSPDTLGRRKIVTTLQLHSGDLLDHAYQL